MGTMEDKAKIHNLNHFYYCVTNCHVFATFSRCFLENLPVETDVFGLKSEFQTKNVMESPAKIRKKTVRNWIFSQK